MFIVSRGRVVRNDGQPLRTKIVATLGSDTSYRDGITRVDGQPLKEITYRTLVENFIASGADVIRLNLSHVPLDDVAAVYSAVRDAILSCERAGVTSKRVAVLADLPGPKIRFAFQSDVEFVIGGEFTVRFAATEGDNTGLVYVDNKPLKEAMADADRNWPVLQHEDADAQQQKLIENVLGVRLVERGQQISSRFDTLMYSIRQRVSNGQDVLVRIGDGEVVLCVDPSKFDVRGDSLSCHVVTAKKKTLRGKKGFTLKGVHLEIPSLTREDREKLDKLLDCEFSDPDSQVLAFVALSFAQTANDVLRIKYHIDQKRSGKDYKAPAIITKIESEKGWLNREYILDVADGVMVARGDLGLQMEIENVPAIQKRLIQLCNKRGKPVITATEMLKSMTDSMEPTRAEGSDVFNAIVDGSDAVMMSEETSTGRFPLHSIMKMVAIADEAERYAEMTGRDINQQKLAYRGKFETFFQDADPMIIENRDRISAIVSYLGGDGRNLYRYFETHAAEIEWYRKLYRQKGRKAMLQRTTDRITQATCTMSEADEIKAILAPTTSGRTVRMIARMKPRVPVIGAAHDMLNTRKLIISYGVWPLCIGEVTQEDGPEGMFRKCLEQIAADDRLDKLLLNAEVIFTAGSPVNEPGTTNLIQIKAYTRDQN